VPLLHECGGREDRNHLLFYYNRWEKKRQEVWQGWWGGLLSGEGWIEMDRFFFSEKGVKRILEFANRIGWWKWEWGRGKSRRGEDRKGWLLRERIEGKEGWMRERTERRRREVLESMRLRVKKGRDKRRLEENQEQRVERLKREKEMRSKREREIGKVEMERRKERHRVVERERRERIGLNEGRVVKRY